MTLNALVVFNTFVDTHGTSVGDRNVIKAQGATLARAAIREGIAHITEHIDAAVGDSEMVARVTQMKKYLASVRVSDG